VIIRGAGREGQDIQFTVERPSDPVAREQTYTAPVEAQPGAWQVEIRFFAGAAGSGDVVGLVSATGAVLSDAGALTITVDTSRNVTSVEITPGQRVDVGAKKDLLVTVRNREGALLALSPGSFFVTVPPGSGDRLRTLGGLEVEGLRPGVAALTVSVDGVASAPAEVRVTSQTSVAISPAGPLISPGATVRFAATVANAPEGAVTWSVQEGQTGGVVTVEGVYTAPTTPGVYHVLATSVYDPSRQAVATVTVATGGVEVGGEFPPSGGAEIGGEFPGSGGVAVGID
jgi:hypothetical protein